MKVHDLVSSCLLVSSFLSDLVRCVVHSLHGVVLLGGFTRDSIHIQKPDN